MSQNSCSTGACGSGNGPDMDRMLREMQIKETLGKIRHKVVVLSGKGGVGKSTVAASLALKLALEGKQVGIMDVDIHGPSIPKIFGVKDQRPATTAEEKMLPVSVSDNLKLMSIGFLLPNDREALIWRGPLKIGLIEQFFSDVDWGELDYLVVDCPPGTGDEPLSILQTMPDAHGIIVTTPQGMAVEDVQKSITFCRKLNLKLEGIVENMGVMACPHCGREITVFPGNGGEEMAKEAGVPLLAKLPLNHKIMAAADNGQLAQVFKEMDPFEPVVAAMLDLKPVSVEQPASAPPVAQGDGRIRVVAVPVEPDGTLAAHFGHASGFEFFTVDTKKQVIVEKKSLTPPEHQPGVIPRWVAEQGAHVMLAGGMGESARAILNELGVEPVLGVMPAPSDRLVKTWMAGELAIGGNTCDHDSHGGHSCSH